MFPRTYVSDFIKYNMTRRYVFVCYQEIVLRIMFSSMGIYLAWKYSLIAADGACK